MKNQMFGANFSVLSETCQQMDGIHILMDAYGCPSQLLDAPAWWEELIEGALVESGIGVLHRHFHRFDPHGLTGIFLLSASHLSVHTWPEHGYAAIDIFTCSPEAATECVMERLRCGLPHKEMSFRKLCRGFQSMGVAC